MRSSYQDIISALRNQGFEIKTTNKKTEFYALQKKDKIALDVKYSKDINENIFYSDPCPLTKVLYLPKIHIAGIETKDVLLIFYNDELLTGTMSVNENFKEAMDLKYGAAYEERDSLDKKCGTTPYKEKSVSYVYPSELDSTKAFVKYTATKSYNCDFLLNTTFFFFDNRSIQKTAHKCRMDNKNQSQVTNDQLKDF